MLDGVSDADIVDLDIPTGIPLVYELDVELQPLRHYYLGEAERSHGAKSAQARSGSVESARGRTWT